MHLSGSSQSVVPPTTDTHACPGFIRSHPVRETARFLELCEISSWRFPTGCHVFHLHGWMPGEVLMSLGYIGSTAWQSERLTTERHSVSRISLFCKTCYNTVEIRGPLRVPFRELFLIRLPSALCSSKAPECSSFCIATFFQDSGDPEIEVSTPPHTHTLTCQVL